MRKLLLAAFAIGMLALFADSAEACGRFGRGRILDRIRHRDGPIFQRIRDWASPPKNDEKGCPDCKPKAGKPTGDDWEMPEDFVPEMIPAPKRVTL